MAQAHRTRWKKHGLATLAVTAALAPLQASAAFAWEERDFYLYPFLGVAAAGALLFFYLLENSRKQKKMLSNILAEDVVFETAGAGYCMQNTVSGQFIASPHFHHLLELGKPIHRFDALFKALNPESEKLLKDKLEQLKHGKAHDAFYLTLSPADKILECKLQAKTDGALSAMIITLWMNDVTSQRRAQLRMEQENQKLKTELKQYSTILNMAPYPIWQRDKDQTVRYYNLAYGELVEEDSAEREHDKSPELDKRVRALAKQALESGKPASERRHIVVAGARKLFQISELPVKEEQITVGFAVDMSEVEALKEDLARHISAQDDFLESSASAMAIFGGDMRLKSFNFAYVALWKLDELWLDTQPTFSEILEVLRERRKLPEQANFQLFKQQQLKLFTDLIEPREEFFYLPDGKALRVLAIPHALGGIMFAYEDVTDRLALERSYNTLIAVQRETLDNLHEGVAVFGEDGRLKLYNPGYLKLWNVDKELANSEPHVGEIIDRNRSLFTYDDWEQFRHQHIHMIQTREFFTKRLELTNGKVIDWRKVPLPDGASLITYLDITDSTLVERSLRERNEALQEADKLKTEFLANVSYELRSPLTSISGFSEMLKQEYFGPLSDKQKEYVGGIYQSSQHLMQLINDILDLASVEAGYMRLEVAKFDVYAMMKSVLSLISERVKEYNIEVKFECPSKIGKMTGDETRIKQILFNLLSNAIKYSDAGNAITLGAKETDDEHLMLWVQDEGKGIPPEEHAAIFEKFYKGRNQEAIKGKSGQRSGTGLGLSIVKSFIELHGGHVELHSELGKGARFECHLLRHNPELQQFLKSKKAA